jgi:hypothetical protein
MEISALTSSGDSPCNSSGMPSSDTSNFSITSVRFLLQMSNTPSFHDTGKSLTFGDTDYVNDLILSEDLINSDFLFE